MKRIAILLVLVLTVINIHAQEKSGVVYSDHKMIKKTKDMWSALVKADKEMYVSYYADTVFDYTNGVLTKRVKKDLAGDTGWTTEFENLQVRDDSPAYPDAIEYKDGAVWVQDWLRVTGTHKKTGINLDLPVHNLYAFNKDGKIFTIHTYFNDAVFEEINNSLATKENGTVYINHPNILTVRKLINAFTAKDFETFKGFYSEKARFANSTMEWGESMNYDEYMEGIKAMFSEIDNIRFDQKGYPDCIYYAKNDVFVVYSWWEYFYTEKESGKKRNIPILLSHYFNKEGQVVSETLYFSSNHWND